MAELLPSIVSIAGATGILLITFWRWGLFKKDTPSSTAIIVGIMAGGYTGVFAYMGIRSAFGGEFTMGIVAIIFIVAACLIPLWRNKDNSSEVKNG